jgi:hypothetical protein
MITFDMCLLNSTVYAYYCHSEYFSHLKTLTADTCVSSTQQYGPVFAKVNASPTEKC